jgi:hypothetical protein
MRMPEDDLANNLDWSSGSGCKSCGMASEIMRLQIHTRQLTRFFDHNHSSIAGNWGNPLFRSNSFVLDIFSKSVRDFLGSYKMFWLDLN